MLLVIDIGNTNTTFAVFREDELVSDWRISTRAERTADEYAVFLSGLFANVGLNPTDIDGVCISSVVPGAIRPLRRLAQAYLGDIVPLVLTSSTDTGIKVHYAPPTDVGADRLANAAAAREIYGGPVIVVDFGTATTLDAVSGEGDYLGGAIAPGIEISANALVRLTAQLRRVEFTAPPKAIGTTTVESMQSGIIYGFAGQVDALVQRFLAEMGEAKVVATGGLAEIIAPHSCTIQDVNPLLTLIGLRIIHGRATRP